MTIPIDKLFDAALVFILGLIIVTAWYQQGYLLFLSLIALSIVSAGAQLYDKRKQTQDSLR